MLLGDPSGIGPEVTAKLLAMPETRPEAAICMIGDRGIYRTGAEIARVATDAALEFIDYPGPACVPGKADAACGAYALETLRVGLEQLHAGSVDALVYAPLNKQAMKLAGMKHEDELHYFASLLGYSGTISEINVCGGLWTSRVTSHVPLQAVSGLVTRDKILESAYLLQRSLVAAGVDNPRVAIAALNPHAGEGGLLGSEEITTIGPAVDELRAKGMNAVGPLPADTLFIAARRGEYDGVVTMYHDQGQIALKLLGFDRGVTVAGGLPVPITTPAHGTAFDIVGRGIADPGAMREAFRIACRMATRNGSRS